MSLSDQSLQFFPVSARVSVLRARGLRIKGKDGTNDAYTALQAGRETFRTPVAEKRAEPVWGGDDAAFIFTLPPESARAEQDSLQVRVLHRVPIGADKLLGLTVINVHELRQNSARENPQWFKLLNKAGKADKERGEILLDIQFLKSSMSVSMIDLSEKSHSRLGKFKDKLRGKKKEGLSDSASAILPSVSQVLTDSEGEMDGETEGESTKKKKNKLKSLFVPKSNMKRNSMSQSMSSLGTLPDKNSSISSSTSSGLNVDSSEGKKKKKFTFLTHKRTGSTDSKASNHSDFTIGSTNQSPPSQIDICINGSRVYREQTQGEEVQEMDEEEEEEEEGEGEKEERWRREEEDRERLEEKRRREAEEERKRKEKEDQKRKEDEEKEKIRREREKEEHRRRLEEEENERIRVERVKEEQRRKMEEDEKERMRIEKEKEEQKRRMEEEEKERVRMAREREEQRRRMEEEEKERIRLEREKEEQRRMEEEEKERIRMAREREDQRRMEEEEKERIRMAGEREEQRRRMEEEEKDRIRMVREREDQRRMEEEEKERIRMEREKEEQRRRRLEEEERERQRIEKEEQIRKLEEDRKRKEREAEVLRRKLEEENNRKKAVEEEKMRIAEEERMKEEKKRAERRRVKEEEEKQNEEKRIEMEKRLADEKKAREEEARRIAEEKEKQRQEEERIREEKEQKRAEIKRKEEEQERRNVEMEEKKKKEKQMRDEQERLRKEENVFEERDFTRSARISNVKPSESRAATVSQPSMANTNPFLDDGLDASLSENVIMVEETTKKGRAPLPPQLAGQDLSSRGVSKDHSLLKEVSKRPAPLPPDILKMTREVTLKENTHQIGLDQGSKKTPERPISSVFQEDEQVDTNPFLCEGPVAVKHNKKPAPKPRSGITGSEDKLRNDGKDLTESTVHLEEKTSASNSKGNPSNWKLSREPNDITAKDVKNDLMNNLAKEEHLKDIIEPDSTKPNTPSVINWNLTPEALLCKTDVLPSMERSQKKPQAPLPPAKPKRTGDPSTLLQQSSLLNKIYPEQAQENHSRTKKEQDNTSSTPSTVSSSTFTLLAENSQVMKPCATELVETGSDSGSRTFPWAKVIPNDAGEVRKQVASTSVIRQHAVKPLSSAENQSETPESRVTDNTQPKTKAPEAVMKGPYSQLTQAELISLALRQQEHISQRDARIQELEQYIDNLLVRVMEEKPSILMTLNTKNKSV